VSVNRREALSSAYKTHICDFPAKNVPSPKHQKTVDRLSETNLLQAVHTSAVKTAINTLK